MRFDEVLSKVLVQGTRPGMWGMTRPQSPGPNPGPRSKRRWWTTWGSRQRLQVAWGENFPEGFLEVVAGSSWYPGTVRIDIMNFGVEMEFWQLDLTWQDWNGTVHQPNTCPPLPKGRLQIVLQNLLGRQDLNALLYKACGQRSTLEFSWIGWSLVHLQDLRSGGQHSKSNTAESASAASYGQPPMHLKFQFTSSVWSEALTMTFNYSKYQGQQSCCPSKVFLPQPQPRAEPAPVRRPRGQFATMLNSVSGGSKTFRGMASELGKSDLWMEEIPVKAV